MCSWPCCCPGVYLLYHWIDQHRFQPRLEVRCKGGNRFAKWIAALAVLVNGWRIDKCEVEPEQHRHEDEHHEELDEPME